MVGWSRRNAEDAARARRRREWFNSLPQDEQDRITREEEERWQKEKPGTIALIIFALLSLFVGWPLAAIHLGKMRWQAEWDSGKIVSQDAKQVCKEVEYCSPCSPIHHWHKKVFCEPVDKK